MSTNVIKKKKHIEDNGTKISLKKKPRWISFWSETINGKSILLVSLLGWVKMDMYFQGIDILYSISATPNTKYFISQILF